MSMISQKLWQFTSNIVKVTLQHIASLKVVKIAYGNNWETFRKKITKPLSSIPCGRMCTHVYTHIQWKFHPHLLLCDVYRLVQDDPRGGLVAGRHRDGAVVRHVIFRVRQQFSYHETFNLHRLACVQSVRSITWRSDSHRDAHTYPN